MGTIGSFEQSLIALIFYALAAGLLFTATVSCLHLNGTCIAEHARLVALQDEAVRLRIEITRLTTPTLSPGLSPAGPVMNPEMLVEGPVGVPGGVAELADAFDSSAVQHLRGRA